MVKVVVNLGVGENVNLTSGERVNVLSGNTQEFISGKTWLGSGTVNLLAVMSDFTGTVRDCFNVLASHTHPNVGACSQGGTISSRASEVGGQKGSVDGIRKV